MVKQIVASRARQLPPQCELDDCLSCGIEALIRALDRFDPARGGRLESYLWTRIDGAVLDEARRQDWAPRSVRRFSRDRTRTERELFALHGRRPGREEIATALGIDLPELRRQELRLATAEVGSLNVQTGESDDDTVELLDVLPSEDRETEPVTAVLARESEERMLQAMAGLSDRERRVARMLYVEDMTMRETGRLLGVTESRVSQLNSRVKRRVRDALEAELPLAA
ncbi:MAG: FliA/WhiG family polymerase sigma factor [Solirubrobacterales bacterium]|nr:FliA/WhiG family polymerase sigma factor [Solirubrobacterales bacterium]